MPGVMKVRVGGAWIPALSAGGGGGNVSGPPVTLPGQVAVWNNTTGSLLADSGIIANQIVLTADARLTDARAPLAHATTHKSGGSDAIKLDELAPPSDSGVLNASTTAHGLLAKLPGNTTMFLRGDGTWVVPTAPTPAAHATTHAAVGSDPLNILTLAGFNASPGSAYFLRGDGVWSNTCSSYFQVQGPLVATLVCTNTVDGNDNLTLALAGGGTAGSTRGAWINLCGNEANTGLLQLFPGAATGSRVDMYRADGNTPMASWYAADGTVLFTSTNYQAWQFNSTYVSGGYLVIQKNGTACVQIGAANAQAIGSGTTNDAAIKAPNGALYLESGSAIRSVTIYTDTTSSAPNVFVQFDGRVQRSTSSLRYKDHVTALADADWRWLLHATPISFTEKKRPDGPRFAGLAAEDVARLAPMYAVFNEAGQPDEVAYTHLVAPIIRAIQDLYARLNSLSARGF